MKTENCVYKVKAEITNIQRLCTHDGPGIRTTVFLASSPMLVVPQSGDTLSLIGGGGETDLLLPAKVYRLHGMP